MIKTLRVPLSTCEDEKNKLHIWRLTYDLCRWKEMMWGCFDLGLQSFEALIIAMVTDVQISIWLLRFLLSLHKHHHRNPNSSWNKKKSNPTLFIMHQHELLLVILRQGHLQSEFCARQLSSNRHRHYNSLNINNKKTFLICEDEPQKVQCQIRKLENHTSKMSLANNLKTVSKPSRMACYKVWYCSLMLVFLSLCTYFCLWRNKYLCRLNI